MTISFQVLYGAVNVTCTMLAVRGGLMNSSMLVMLMSGSFLRPQFVDY